MPRTPGGFIEFGEPVPPSRRRRRGLRLLVAGMVGVLAVAAWLGWRQWSAGAVEPSCTVRAGAPVTLAPEQTANAAVITAVALRRGLPERAVTIALATAMQESKLRNLRYGDRDSLGLFQQRPSQGWGTPEQVLDPIHASEAFYDRLVKVKDYLTRPLTEVAQQVQRSGAPTAYAQHEDEAAALAAALSGSRPAALTCELSPAVGGGRPARLAEQLSSQHGLPASAAPAGGPSVVVEAPSGRAWAVAAWAVAHADAFQVTGVAIGGRTWSRAQSQWSAPPSSAADSAPGASLRVEIELAR